MEIFSLIASSPVATKNVTIHSAPYSWIPFLKYLSCSCVGGQHYFEHDTVVLQMIGHIDATDRTLIETLAGFRPELVDALWKCDMQWKTDRPLYPGRRDFIVTTNGSFHRREVIGFMKTLDSYHTTAKTAVVLPCAADKPYPSPLHQKVKTMVGEHTELCIATGVLGIVPESTWSFMPFYDSGVPNEWRLYNRAIEFFNHVQYDDVIFYVDFYSNALYAAVNELKRLGCKTDFTFVNAVEPYDDYIDLLNEHRLNDLQEAIDLPSFLCKQSGDR